MIISESPGKVNPWQWGKSGEKEGPLVRTLPTLETWFRAQFALAKKTCTWLIEKFNQNSSSMP
jgi:hypothetical protein